MPITFVSPIKITAGIIICITGTEDRNASPAIIKMIFFASRMQNAEIGIDINRLKLNVFLISSKNSSFLSCFNRYVARGSKTEDTTVITPTRRFLIFTAVV